MHQRIARVPRSRRRHRRVVRAIARVAAGVALVLAVPLTFAALRLAGVVGDLREARSLLEQASAELEDGRIADARASLERAHGLLLAANGDLYGSPDVSVASIVPVVSTNLGALRHDVGVAVAAAGIGARLLAAAQPLEGPTGDLEVPLRAGAVPLDTVDAVRDELRSLLAAIPTGAAPDSPLLLPQVRDLGRELYESLGSRRARVAALEDGLELVEEMTGGNGDRRYLIAVGNSAEMRATGGMILSYGVLEGRAGDIALPVFGPIDELFLTDPVTEPVDGGTGRWAGFEPLRLWRNANVVPDSEVVGPRLVAMAEARSGVPFDGVLQIDPLGLSAILQGIGPVEVEGLGTVDAGNVVDLTLNRAYFLFPDSDQRREVLGDVAEAVFRRLVDGEYDSLRALGEALATAAAERHVSLWSHHPGAAGPAAAFGADAPVPAPDALDHLLLTVQNVGRDKLDYYLDTAVRVRGSRPAGELGSLTVDVTLTNTAPAGQRTPAYVFGDPSVGRTGPVGHYLGVVSLYVPVGTGLESATGGATVAPTLVAEGERSVVGFDVAVPPGGSTTVTLHLSLPPRPEGPYELTLVPVPRVRPTTWDVDVDGITRHGPLRRQETIRPA